jgi:hypothetical protein
MKVAFDKIDITPKDYYGKPLAGYDRKERCLGKLDNIYAYGVLLRVKDEVDKEKHLLLISVDILKLPFSIVEYIKKRIIDRVNFLHLDDIIIHATHTHSSFDLTGEFYYQGGAFAFIKGVMFADNKNDKFIIWMSDRISQMVERLKNNLQPCKGAWKKEEFNPNLVVNRRWPLRNTMPYLGVISFKSLNEEKIIGLVINYACHPTSLSFKNNKLSADYPGRIIAKIEELTNNSIKCIYFNGPSGDLNPITTSGTDLKKIEEDKKLTYDQLGTYEHTKKIGFTIAEESLKLANSIKEEDYIENFKLKNYSKNLTIPMKDARYFSKTWFGNSLKWAIKKYFLFKIARFDQDSVNFPFFKIIRRNLRKYCETVIQFIILKAQSGPNLGIMTIPGELFDEIGKRILISSPTSEKNTFIFQNSQDWIGYLFPLKTYIDEGGYEPFMCFSPLCGQIIEIQSKTLLKSVTK